jgi:hypothetical protein
VCADCGANFIMAGRDHYACASRLNGGEAACTNDLYLRRSHIEPGLIAGIKRDLLNETVITEILRRTRVRLRSRKDPTAEARQRIDSLENQVLNLADAVAAGALRSSPAIAERLHAAETELAQLRAAAAAPTLNVEELLPRLADRCRQLRLSLERTLASADVAKARAELQTLIGPISVVATPETWRLESRRGSSEAILLAASGTYAGSLCQESKYSVNP